MINDEMVINQVCRSSRQFVKINMLVLFVRIGLLATFCSLGSESFSFSFRNSDTKHQLQRLQLPRHTLQHHPKLHGDFFENAEKKKERTKTQFQNNNWLEKWLQACGMAGAIYAVLMMLAPHPSHAETLGAAGKRYWTVMEPTTPAMERVVVNEALMDYAVGTINTQFYDNTGGANFNTKEFYNQWKTMKKVALNEIPIADTKVPPDISLETRQGAVQGLKWLVNSLGDPFSLYLTREELQKELEGDSGGFLGIGAVVEPPNLASIGASRYGLGSSILWEPPSNKIGSNNLRSKSTTAVEQKQQQHSKKFLTNTRVANLPVITAVAPDSPAERAGLVVGDRIVAVGEEVFVGWTKSQVAKALQSKYSGAESYLGHAQLTVAKPVYYIGQVSYNKNLGDEDPNSDQAPRQRTQEIVVGYRQARVLVPTKASYSLPIVRPSTSTSSDYNAIVAGGDNIVHYQMLSSSTGSIFDHSHSDDVPKDDYNVGYIRLTRFSKKSTEGYLKALKELEAAGAQSYILDLRNNYGGVIQEAMLTASTLLRDPHAILCYTMNARGGFTPHDVEEYVVDKRYPGYLLSKESTTATFDQVRKEAPGMFEDSHVDWSPPSSYASLHEQITKRGIRRVSFDSPVFKRQLAAQKKIVILINEGTASSAEVFTAALRDNARTVALVGCKTYGKGLIQHTFPMPDGGGLRITVAEYLTPALRHVTNVGDSRFDSTTGSFVGGGIRPDIACESNGIPVNIRADLCVGVALDALEEAAEREGVILDDNHNKLMGPIAVNFPSSILGNRH